MNDIHLIAFAAIACLVFLLALATLTWALCIAADERKNPTPVPPRGQCPCYKNITCRRWRTCARDPGWQAPDDCPFDTCTTSTDAPTRVSYTALKAASEKEETA